MPQWILICVKCGQEFAHSQVADVGMSSIFWAAKPEVPETGIACVCPSCGHSALYKRTNLLYRA